MKFADFVIPETLDEALTVLRDKGDAAFPVAGATALQYLGDFPDKTAVDITRLGLEGITESNGVFHVGATTTLTDACRYQAGGWVVGRVARLIPSQQIRNISTVGGNITRVFPWSDLPLVFLALDAVMVVRGEAEERVGAVEYFDKQPRKLLKGGKLLVSVEVPAVKRGTGFAYHKENVTHMAFSMMSAAAALRVADGHIQKARLAVGAAVPNPHRLTALESALEGAAAEVAVLDEAIAAGTSDEPWRGKHGMSDEYAAHLASVVVKDVLTEALARAKGEVHD